jgi:hypothetical protein
MVPGSVLFGICEFAALDQTQVAGAGAPWGFQATSEPRPQALSQQQQHMNDTKVTPSLRSLWELDRGDSRAPAAADHHPDGR